MGLSYPPTDYQWIANSEQTAGALNTARKKLASHGKNISCDNTLIFIGRTETGGVAVIQSIPVVGTRVVVFPIHSEHSGNLMPCDTLECQASKMHGITHPWFYVDYIEEFRYNGPMYQSLASSDPKLYHSKPSVCIKALEVFHNPDGGAVAMIPVADYVKRDITAEQRAALGLPMLNCVIGGLVAAEIDPCRVFGDEYNPDDRMTTWPFLSFLFDAVSPGCDIVIGIMPPGANEGRFTFCYYDEVDLGIVPILGLVKGDIRPMQRVQDTIYIATNDPSIEITLSKDLPYSGENETRLGTDVTITPQPPELYIKDHYVEKDPANRPTADEEPDEEPVYRGTRGMHTHGNHVWANAQKDFQTTLVASVNGVIDEFVFKTIGEHLNTTDLVCASNIEGMIIPRNAVEATLTINARVANSPAALARNIKILKRINDKGRHEAKKFKPNP
tara:strand:+ start:46 stop:1380 length:1335 start_codon:yes stop_codon:yes gene_type:complete